MKVLISSLKYLIRNFSVFAIALVFIYSGIDIFSSHRWTGKNAIIQSDVTGYYGYLPAVFIYKDISLKFRLLDENKHRVKIWSDPSPTGKRMIRYTIGQAVMLSPFFLMGHAAAHLLGYDPSGYTVPYKYFLALSSFIYLILGLFALRKVLLRYFEEIPVGITLILITLGTNLFTYYTQEPCMTHAYNFALISIFILYTDNWHKNPGWKNSVMIGIITGLITLVRPFNILVVLVFILYGITSFRGIIDKARLFLQHSPKIITVISIVFLIWIPQFLYWKYTTGHYLYYAYGSAGGSFFFRHPHIIEGLFGYRKGVFLYNPVLVFAFLGLIWLKRYNSKFFYASVIFLCVFIYILFSWWSWWYGGGFSIRTFADIYGILAFPMTAFLTWLWYQKSGIVRIVLSLLVAGTLLQGQFYNWQYAKTILHWSDMTKEAFWYMMWKKKVGPEYKELLCQMDSDLAKKGIYICCPRYGKYKDMPKEEKPCKEIQDISMHYITK